MANLRLDDVSFDDPAIDAAFRRWREAIEAANTWDVAGAVDYDAGPLGHKLHVGGGREVFRAVATSTITARVGNTAGSGSAKFRLRSGTTLTDGATGLMVYSDFSTAVASGKAILIAKDGADYMLVSGDCP